MRIESKLVQSMWGAVDNQSSNAAPVEALIERLVKIHEEAAREALRLRPDEFFGRTNLGRRLLEAGDLEGAVAQYGRGVSYGRHPARLAHLGEGLLRMGQERDAHRLFDEAIWRIGEVVTPGEAYALRTIARSLSIDPDASPRQLAQALGLAVQFKDIWPERDDAWETLGLALYRNEELTEARSVLRQGEQLQIDGVSATLAFVRAMVEYRLGNREGSVSWFLGGTERVQDTRIKDPFVLQLMAEASGLLGL